MRGHSCDAGKQPSRGSQHVIVAFRLSQTCVNQGGGGWICQQRPFSWPCQRCCRARCGHCSVPRLISKAATRLQAAKVINVRPDRVSPKVASRPAKVWELRLSNTIRTPFFVPGLHGSPYAAKVGVARKQTVSICLSIISICLEDALRKSSGHFWLSCVKHCETLLCIGLA